ncbi:MAG: hypothetical protein ABSB35_32015 [Bryobacteraceae bacterium]
MSDRGSGKTTWILTATIDRRNHTDAHSRRDPNVPAAVRLRAAESVIAHAIKGVELEDIETRVAALEESAPPENRKR